MSDLVNMNAAATRQGLEGLEERIRVLETEVMTLKNHNQTLLGLMSQLQQTNNLALAKLRGTGATT